MLHSYCATTPYSGSCSCSSSLHDPACSLWPLVRVSSPSPRRRARRGRHPSTMQSPRSALQLMMLALLASASALPAGKAAGKGPGAPGATKNPAASAVSTPQLHHLPTPAALPHKSPPSSLQSQLGKLRSDMMKWYCAGGQHEDVPPCKVRCRPRRRREAPRTKPQTQPHWLWRRRSAS